MTSRQSSAITLFFLILGVGFLAVIASGCNQQSYLSDAQVEKINTPPALSESAEKAQCEQDGKKVTICVD